MSEQRFSKPHFVFNPQDEKAAAFAKSLQGSFPHYSAEECDHTIGIGGDGTIYWSFANVPGKPNFTLKPPTSSSKLFYGHDGIETAQQLMDAVNNAKEAAVLPLQAKVNFSDGTSKTIIAYSDIVVERFAAQALFQNITANFTNAAQKFGGTGLIFATTIGVTGINKSARGQFIPLGEEQFVATSVLNPFDLKPIKGEGGEIFSRENKRISRVFNRDAVLKLEFISADAKRPVQICFDSKTMMPDGGIFDGKFPITITDERYISSVEISVAQDFKNTLLINDSYRTPAHQHVLENDL